MPAKPCPNCQKPPVAPHTPFCSARCQQLDLGRWLNGSYAIPADEDNELDMDEETQEE